MPPRLILFDFDGTLADSFHATLAAGNRLAAANGYRCLTEAEARALRGKSIREIIKTSDVPLRRLPSWMRQMKEELFKETPRIQPPTGMTEALATLRDMEIPLGIVTSNARENVDLFLANNGWSDWFTHFETGANLFGKSRLIRRILDRVAIEGNSAVYVGDEERDITAARKAGVSAVAVTWGYNDRVVLAQSQPDHLIDFPGELPGIFAPIA